MSMIASFQAKNATWQGVFILGVAGLGLAAIKAWWSAAPAIYQPPPPAAAVPASGPAFTAAPSARPASKIIRVQPQASSFTPLRIAPADLPPELSGLSRPPADPAPWVAPVGVQPGFKISEDPQPRDIR